jgi:hypothetical protein
MVVLFILSLLVTQLSAQAVEPEEPDIVLPEVILQVADLVVENVEAELPEETDLFPPEREAPLPEEGELTVEEPAQPLSTPSGIEESLPATEPGLIAEGILGAGSLDHLYGSISLYQMGVEPRFKLKFLHETLDGFGGHEQGSGYNFREDFLWGGVKFKVGNLLLDSSGEFHDIERGFQGKGTFTSRIFRAGQGEVEAEYPLGERLWLLGNLEAGFFSRLLTGSDAQETTEILVAPELSLELRSGKNRLGLSSLYKYSSLLEDDESVVTRLELEGYFGVDFLPQLRVEGSGGWFWNNELGNFFPFALTLSGALFDVLSFGLSGGYRIEHIDYRLIFQDYDLVESPESLSDNHGWYSDLNISYSLSPQLSLLGGGSLSWNKAMVDPYADPTKDLGIDQDSGLFPFRQVDADRFSSRIGLRWYPLSVLGLSGSWEMEWLDHPGFTPQYKIRLEAEVKERLGKWGGNGYLLQQDWPGSQLPLMGISGFYKLSGTIKLILEIEDILALFQNDPRTIWYPYEEPGFYGIVKVQISL